MKDSSGQLYIPGETLKGLTRDAADKLLAMPALAHIDQCHGAYLSKPGAQRNLCGVSSSRRDRYCILCRIFGSPFSQGNFHFSPAYYSETYDKLTSHPEIAGGILPLQTVSTAFNTINQWTGRAQEDHLFSLELGTKRRPFWFTITEQNSLRFVQTRRIDLIFIACSLRMVRKLGGKRRRGKGECSFEIKEIENLDTIGHDLIQENLIEHLKEVAQI